MSRRLFALGMALMATTAQAARIDEGALPDIDRLLQGCWINAEGTLAGQIAAAEGAAQVELCFADGGVGATLLDAAGGRLASSLGSYAFRNQKIVLTGPIDVAWVFDRPTVICDVGVKPHVRLGLFGCVGSGPDQPVAFFDDLLFLAPPRAAT